MSSSFKPLQIPPGVVATPTKNMSSSNWAETNLVRWTEQQMSPVGGQTKFSYSFASRAKAIHGWYGLDQVYRTAYLCERNLYVAEGDTLTDISPSIPLATPSAPGFGGYGDGNYNEGTYNDPRALPYALAMDTVPNAFSLDNFGSVLYAMTSPDGRLLKWDPAAGQPGAGGTVTATASFTTSSTAIPVGAVPAWVKPGMDVYDTTTGKWVGVVLSTAPASPVTVAALTAFTTAYSGILMPPNPGGIAVGASVFDATSGHPIGTMASYAPVSSALAAAASFAVGYYAILMPPNPGWAVPGLSVTDTTTSHSLGSVLGYGPYNRSFSATGNWPAGSAIIPLHNATVLGVVPGMTVFDHDLNVSLGVVASADATTVTFTAPIAVASYSTADILTFSAGTSHVLKLDTQIANASAGASDTLQFTSGTNAVLTLDAPIANNSLGATDSLQFSSSYTLTLTAPAASASAGASDVLQLGNLAQPQIADTGRGVVPNGRCFVVTPERFILIFGTYNDGTGGTNGSPRRFAWCDQENPGAWDYSNVVSQAGFLDVEPASPIICAISSRTGNLFFTAKKAYRSRFLGLPYIYNYEELADGCTPWSPQSMAATSALVLWMSQQGAFSFDGTSILPVACLVRPWVDDDIDLLHAREEACAVHVSSFSEFWWFFPQTLGHNPAGYNTRAIIYNYKEGWWGQARMARSAGVTASYSSHTIMADGVLAYQHENGSSYSTDAELPFAETFDLNIAGGGRLVTVKQLLPDIDTMGLDDPTQIANAIMSLRYSLFYRNSRSIGAPELQTELKSVRDNGYVDFRTTGRDVRLRIEVVGPVPPVTVGAHQIDVVVRGDR